MKWRLLLILAVLVVTGGCAPMRPVRQEEIGGEDLILVYGGQGFNDIFRFVDRDARVVCWLWRGELKGGIYCLPLSETSLDY